MKSKFRETVTLFLVFVFRVFNKLDAVRRYVRGMVVDAYWGSRLGFKGEAVRFYKGVIIHSPEKVFIDNNSRIGDYVHMWGAGGIHIGKNVLIAAHSVITSQTHDVNALSYVDSQLMDNVTISDNVWIGASAVLLPGVSIGENSIVGAGAVVTKNVPPDAIAQGVPAEIKKLIR